MVAEPRAWVDVEGAIREWARDYVSSVERRVFFEVRRGFPQIVVFRIAGTDDAALIQFDVWAEGKAQAAAIAVELCTAADALSRYEYEDVLLHGARIESSRWQPDEESGQARYVIDMTFTATASSSSAS